MTAKTVKMTARSTGVLRIGPRPDSPTGRLRHGSCGLLAEGLAQRLCDAPGAGPGRQTAGQCVDIPALELLPFAICEFTSRVDCGPRPAGHPGPGGRLACSGSR